MKAAIRTAAGSRSNANRLVEIAILYRSKTQAAHARTLMLNRHFSARPSAVRAQITSMGRLRNGAVGEASRQLLLLGRPRPCGSRALTGQVAEAPRYLCELLVSRVPLLIDLSLGRR